MPDTSSELEIDEGEKADFDLQKELAAIENKELGINVHSPIFDPKMDIAFKAIFAQNTPESDLARRDFLSSVLDVNVTKATVLSNEYVATGTHEKPGSTDLHIQTDTGDEIIIEMQLKTQEGFINRNELRICQLFGTQKAKGVRYPKVHKAIQILITNFTLFPEEDGFIDEYQYRNPRAKILSGMTKMVYIELTKLRKIMRKPLETLSSVEMWALFLKYGNDLKRQKMLSKLKDQKEGIKMADTILETISKDRVAQLKYFSDYYRENDEWNRFMDATEKGLEQGLEQGLVQGESIGRQKERQEIEQKRQQERRESARKMLKDGIDCVKISKYTGLTLEEIKALNN